MIPVRENSEVVIIYLDIYIYIIIDVYPTDYYHPDTIILNR